MYIYLTARLVNEVEVHSKNVKDNSSLADMITGSDVLSLTGRPVASQNFKTELYFDTLRLGNHGSNLLLSTNVTSTQDLILTLAKVLPEGTVLLAETQSNGRGRGDNTWVSSTGCLMFSFTSRFYDGPSLPCVQYLATLALIRAIRKHIFQVSADIIDLEPLKIKWPNDLYYGHSKIGGVLCNSTFSDGAYVCTTGIGLNVFNKNPSICLADLLTQTEKDKISKELLLATFFDEFSSLKILFQREGFAGVKMEYTSHWMHTNERVKAFESKDGHSCLVDMTIKGLTSTGLLHAEDAFGEAYELSPDGNSLDFFTGLIRRKLDKN
jgi:biotin--protein ligase